MLNVTKKFISDEVQFERSFLSCDAVHFQLIKSILFLKLIKKFGARRFGLVLSRLNENCETKKLFFLCLKVSRFPKRAILN
jgi:hypothetical protein